MYAMHYGVVYGMTSPLIEDEQTGYRLRPGKVPEGGAIFSLHTDADLDYRVFVDGDSWEEWGDHGLHHPSLHLVIKVNNEIEAKEADLIRTALESVVTGGRLVDWSVLTNEENWREVVGYYLHRGRIQLPTVVQVSPEPMEGG